MTKELEIKSVNGKVKIGLENASCIETGYMSINVDSSIKFTDANGDVYELSFRKQ